MFWHVETYFRISNYRNFGHCIMAHIHNLDFSVTNYVRESRSKYSYLLLSMQNKCRPKEFVLFVSLTTVQRRVSKSTKPNLSLPGNEPL